LVFCRFCLLAFVLLLMDDTSRGFSSFLASTAALIATGWSEPVPGRVNSRCGSPPFHGASGNVTYIRSHAAPRAIASRRDMSVMIVREPM
jgi:hypothetical protein